MEKLRMFIAQELVVATSCLIDGVSLFFPDVVRPILDSIEGRKHILERHPSMSDVLAASLVVERAFLLTFATRLSLNSESRTEETDSNEICFLDNALGSDCEAKDWIN
ncbi:hypothetical protein SADUNF_Sadunf18G0004000 [Salix dunnii]|uniref:Uncharacterized protein n=1 Tax=Salix dunnii TaxID=1413687 RepID=A0A835J1V7_9ROSI|nr:hypothetical protein SADUNF_Sadunf18G0004000 [Salix dunnii]